MRLHARPRLRVTLAFLFSVELGAAIRVAFIALPCSSSKPWPLSKSLTVTRLPLACVCPWSLAKRQHSTLIGETGERVNTGKTAIQRHVKEDFLHRWVRQAINYCRKRCVRSIISSANGGPPVQPSRRYSAISAAQGTKRFICSRSPHLWVLSGLKLRFSTACCKRCIFSGWPYTNRTNV